MMASKRCIKLIKTCLWIDGRTDENSTGIIFRKNMVRTVLDPKRQVSIGVNYSARRIVSRVNQGSGLVVKSQVQLWILPSQCALVGKHDHNINQQIGRAS